MDVLLIALHGIFFAPLFQRLARRAPKIEGADKHSVTGSAVLAPHVWPILILHGAGLALFYAGLVMALVTGRITKDLTARGVIGTAVLLSADILMIWSFLALRSWRVLPKIDTDHQLCTTGPYGLVRHPMYLAINLLAVGTAVWVSTLPLILAVIPLVVGGDLRARAEENALLAAFGDRYRRYMRRVRRTLPGVY